MKKLLLSFVLTAGGFVQATDVLDVERAQLTQKVYRLEGVEDDGLSEVAYNRTTQAFKDFKYDLLSLKLVCKYRQNETAALAIMISHWFEPSHKIQGFFQLTPSQILDQYAAQMGFSSDDAYRFFQLYNSASDVQKNAMLSGLNERKKYFYKDLAGKLGPQPEETKSFCSINNQTDNPEGHGIEEPEILAKLDRIEKFKYACGFFTQNLKSLFAMSNLKSLKFHMCYLERDEDGPLQPMTISEDLGRLRKLQILEFSDIRCIHLPQILWSLNNLRSLTLYNLELDAVPAEIKNLTGLIKLNIGYNNLQTPPVEVRDMTHLKSIEIGQNPFVDNQEFVDELRDWFLPHTRIKITSPPEYQEGDDWLPFVVVTLNGTMSL